MIISRRAWSAKSEPGPTTPFWAAANSTPWLLLGELESDQPKGWVFESLVAVSGNIARVPFTDHVIVQVTPTASATGTASPSVTATPTTPAATATSTPTTANFGVTGEVTGEVNIRYGPGIEYPRTGVAYAGNRFEITGYHTQYPWLRIQYADAAGGQAWVARDLLEITGNIFDTAAISLTRFSIPPLTPTPPAVHAIGINGRPSLPLGGALQILANELWQLLLQNGFDPQASRFGALFMMDLSSGEAFTFGDEYAFSGTSLNKIAILAKLYQQLDTPPSIGTATDILNTMICSENAATNRLLEIIGNGNAYFGAEAVTAFYQDLGLARSFLTAPFTTIGTPEPPPHPVLLPQTSADQVKAEPDLSNQLTVSEIGSLLANIYQCAFSEGGALIETFGDAIEPARVSPDAACDEQ